ncbi:MAG: hypothetical protein JST35_11740 [Armatimonadetes bacterium]|nr:hypothetical protein [Armatimonadota bacterium]
MKSELKAFCQSRGYEPVPINDRLEAWEYAAENFMEEFELDDYRNDLDGRRILDELKRAQLMNSTQIKRLEKADEAFAALTDLTDECVWGEKTAKQKGWTQATHPYYFRHPKAT